MSDIKQLAALTALNNMMESGHVSICTVDEVAKLLGIDHKGEARDVLSTIHCVKFAKMPDELRAAVPGLIEKCLGMAPFYEFKTARPEVRVIDVTPEPPKKTGFLRLLGGSR